jgi:hypothetical protein
MTKRMGRGTCEWKKSNRNLKEWRKTGIKG